MKVTMQDVADMAGVDKATVSRALKGDFRISEKTKSKVANAVKELGYRVDRNASALSASRSWLIGIVLPDLAVPWFGSFLAGLDRAVSNSEYEIMVKCTGGIGSRAMREYAKLVDRRAEGIIWGDAGHLPEVREVPFVALGFSCAGVYSIVPEHGETPPTFELGALAGRLMLKLISGRPVPCGGVIVRRKEDASVE